jgi:hypothetical protein
MAGDGYIARRGASEAIDRALVTIILAVQIRREYCMDRPAVDMPSFSMVMIGFRMHVEQRDGKHPHNDPGSQRDV